MFATSVWDPFTSFGFRADPRLADLRRALSERDTRSAPHVDYRETETGYAFAFDVPGLTEGDIELEVHGQVLSLRAERKHQLPEGYTAHRIERPSFRLAQSFTLPTRVDVEKVTATLADGVLAVTLPKAAEAHARRITIQANLQNPVQS